MHDKLSLLQLDAQNIVQSLHKINYLISQMRIIPKTIVDTSLKGNYPANTRQDANPVIESQVPDDECQNEPCKKTENERVQEKKDQEDQEMEEVSNKLEEHG